MNTEQPDGEAPESTEGVDLTRQLLEIVGQIARVMDAEGCTIFLHDEEKGELFSRVLADGTRGEIRVKVGEGIAGKVMQSGVPINIPDVNADRRYVARFDRGGFATRSMLCLPLANPRGERIGVVQVLNKRGGAFTAADESLLASLNSQVAIALENARLYVDLGVAQRAERELTEQLAAKHQELQEAFLKLESAKVEAETRNRRIQLLRLAAIVGAVVLFAGVGLLSIRGGLVTRDRAPGPTSSGTKAGEPEIVTVAVQKVRSTIQLESSFAPLRTVNVTAGLGGVISRIDFHYGQRVAEGDPLLEIDTTSEEVARRLAHVEVIRAAEKVQELTAWRESAIVTDAERAVTRSENLLRDAERRARETERLFSKGIVGGDEREAAKRELDSITLEAGAAADVLRRALAQGNEANLRIAKMTLENAEVAEKRVAARIAAARVKAPLSGVVLLPPGKAEGGKGAPGLAARTEVTAGQQLLQIGDLGGLTLAGTLDEFEIGRVKIGQKVLVTSSALPEMKLEGKVVARASQGRLDGQAYAFRYDILVEISSLPPEWADRVMLGMSASMEIVIAEDEPKLLVPIRAVQFEGESAWVLRLDPKTGSPSRHPVTANIATRDSIEISSGLTAGDRIQVP